MGTPPVTDFPELLRYSYLLTSNSVVLDVGGYDGRWAENMVKLYNPIIHVFEPVPRFAEIIRRRLAGNPNVFVHQCAVSDENEEREFYIRSNDSGFEMEEKVKPVTVRCVDIVDTLCGGVDLLKLNVEGEEYRILRRLLDAGEVGKCKEIQVQFHGNVKGFDQMRFDIRTGLMETHYPTYDYPYVWENWRRRE